MTRTWRVTAPDRARRRRRRAGLLAAATLAGAATVVGGTATLPGAPRAAPPLAGPLPPASFPAAIPVLPAEKYAPSDSPGRTGHHAAPRARTTRGHHAAATRGASPPPMVDLVVGTTIGLELSGRPGYRVRHRDFLGRVDAIGRDSSHLDQADSRFTVRAGLAGDGCISLESVNYPQRFLRHQNFVIHLDRRDRTALFAADATFCPAPRRAGDAVSLRSYNYPDRYVTERGSRLFLMPATAAGATAFGVRPPL